MAKTITGLPLRCVSQLSGQKLGYLTRLVNICRLGEPQARVEVDAP